MMAKLFQYTLISLLLFTSACSSGDDGDTTPPPPPGNGGEIEPTPNPQAATLVFPEDESECLEGVVIDLQNSEVTFEWNPAEDVDYYQVSYTNLESGITLLRTSDTNTATITLERGVPYSWSVISRAYGVQTSAESEIWRFYNQGPGIENYAPFPAQAVSPQRGATLSGVASVDLVWEGSDVDGDIDFFEVFVASTNPPATSIGTTENSTLSTNVTASTTYYWQVKSTDAFGNSSLSEVFEFRIE